MVIRAFQLRNSVSTCKRGIVLNISAQGLPLNDSELGMFDRNALLNISRHELRVHIRGQRHCTGDLKVVGLPTALHPKRTRNQE